MSTRFALGTFAVGRRSMAGLVLDNRVFDLSSHLDEDVTVRELVDRWSAWFPKLQRLADSLSDSAGDDNLDDLRPLPPVLPVGQIFQAGANYRQHVLDLIAGAAHRGDTSDGLSAEDREEAKAALDERARSGSPFVFTGSAHAMIGARDDVELPHDCTQPDWELELAAVIGAPGRRLSREGAMSIVAGYTICNDLTSRNALSRPDAQTLGIDWLAGKNSPTFLPTGPLLVPAGHVPDPMNLRIHLSVNGRTMQDESTADMIFDIGQLIAFISNVSELRPGDLVLTGSPAGNGASHGIFLSPGDVIDGTVEGLGKQHNVCRAELPPGEAAPTEYAGSRQIPFQLDQEP